MPAWSCEITAPVAGSKSRLGPALAPGQFPASNAVTATASLPIHFVDATNDLDALRKEAG
jgi:hypothetical protein